MYCRAILLNRKRPGELQRLPLNVYIQSETQQKNYEEIKKIVTPTEQILLDKFKRVVIRGKRNRGVHVLFSEDVQKHIDFLFKVRGIL